MRLLSHMTARLTGWRSITAAVALGLLAQVSMAPLAQAQQYGDAVFAVVTDISTTDPGRVASGGDWNVLANIFESLVGRGQDGKLAPELATEYAVSEDGLVYDFTLRQGVTFHNGDPFTAEDVVFSWQRAMDPELKFNYVSWAVGKIASVEATGEHSVRITLKARTPTFDKDLKPFFPIVPKNYIEEVGNEAFLNAPVGTGPFRYVSRQVQQNIVLHSYENYWGGAPKVGQVTLQVVPDDNTRLAMLMAGEADIVANVHPLLVGQIDANPDLKTLVIPALQNHFLGFNPQSPVYDPKVREAFNLAINREALTQGLFFGTAQPMNAWCLRGREIGCDDTITGTPYDPERARALIKESGLDTSKPVRLYGLAPGGRPQTKELVEAIASDLRAIGVESQITLMEFGAYLAFKGPNRVYTDHDLLFFTWATWTDDPVGQRLQPILGTGGTSSFYSIPELDALLAAINESSLEERPALINAALKYIDEQHLVIPLMSPNVIYGMRRSADWQPPADLITPILTTL
ncbi:MAG: ABC transporter substrate-binding protein, partial [Devosia sp.]